MIAYKIVGSDYRSLVVRRDSRYSLYYSVGSVVFSLPNTIGILCFSCLSSARYFARLYKDICAPRTLIVNGYVPRPVPLEICCSPLERDFDDYYNSGTLRLATTPTDTVCFNHVEVLKEINNE